MTQTIGDYTVEIHPRRHAPPGEPEPGGQIVGSGCTWVRIRRGDWVSPWMGSEEGRAATLKRLETLHLDAVPLRLLIGSWGEVGP